MSHIENLSEDTERQPTEKEIVAENSSIQKFFVGRERELQILRELLNGARHQQGRFAVLTGPQGIGKSRLISRLSHEAESEGAIYISGRVQPSHVHEPFRAFWNIAFKLAEEGLVEQAWVRELQEKSTALSQPTGKSETESLYALQTQHKLVQQRLARILLSASRKKPLMIELQDAHLATLNAWQLIHYLAKNIVDSRILLLASLVSEKGPANAEKNPVYVDILQRINREGLYERIELSALTDKEARQLIFSLLGEHDFSSRFVNLIFELSGKTPGKLIELLNFAVSKEILYSQNGLWFDRENPDGKLHNEMRGVVREVADSNELLNQLEPDHLEILAHAALFKKTFDHQLLSGLTKKSKIKLLKILLKFSDQQLLTSVGEAEFQLSDPLLKDKLLEQFSKDKQQALHRRLTDVIKASSHLGDSLKVNFLAYHFEEAGDSATALTYLYRSGKQDLENFAFLEAQQALRRSVELMRDHPEVLTPKQQIQLFQDLAWLNRVLGYREQALKDFQEALKRCTGEQEKYRYQVLIQIGLAHFQLHQWDDSQRCLKECLEAESAREDNFILAMAHYGLGNLHFELSNFETSREHYEQALSLAREIDNKSVIARILNNLGAVENISGNRMKAIAMYSQSIPICEELGDNLGLARLHNNIGITYFDEGNWEMADQFYAKSLAVADQMGLIPIKCITFLNRAQVFVMQKNLARAEEYNFKAKRLGERLRDLLSLSEYHKTQGIIERARGHWDAASEHFQKAQHQFASLDSRVGEAEIYYERGVLASKKGDRQESEQCLQTALEKFKALGLAKKVQIIEQKLKAIKVEPSVG